SRRQERYVPAAALERVGPSRERAGVLLLDGVAVDEVLEHQAHEGGEGRDPAEQHEPEAEDATEQGDRREHGDEEGPVATLAEVPDVAGTVADLGVCKVRRAWAKTLGGDQQVATDQQTQPGTDRQRCGARRVFGGV